jgi:hypothetical protein
MNQEVSHPENPGTLDLAQAAELCKCSLHRLRALAGSGAVPATKVGRRWVFSTRLMLEWIETRSMANVRVRSHLHPPGGITVTRALIAGNTAAGIPGEHKSPA